MEGTQNLDDMKLQDEQEDKTSVKKSTDLLEEKYDAHILCDETSFSCHNNLQTEGKFSFNTSMENYVHSGEKYFTSEHKEDDSGHILRDRCRQAASSVYAHTQANEQSFTCNFCGKAFTLNHRLIRHVRTHKNDTPYAYQKSFSEESTLTEHTSTHTAETSFIRDFCNRSFSRKNFLVLHTYTDI